MNRHERNISRRRFLKLGGSTVALLPLALIATDRSAAQGKASKEAVQYQDSPKNGEKCVDCQFFTAPDGCTVVEGKISPQGWCSLFVKKAS